MHIFIRKRENNIEWCAKIDKWTIGWARKICTSLCETISPKIWLHLLVVVMNFGPFCRYYHPFCHCWQVKIFLIGNVGQSLKIWKPLGTSSGPQATDEIKFIYLAHLFCFCLFLYEIYIYAPFICWLNNIKILSWLV